MVDRKLADARDEYLWIADCVGAVLRQTEFQCFGCAALPTNVQSDGLGLRSRRHGDVPYKEAKNSFAVSVGGCWCRPQLRKVTGELEYLSLLFGCYGAHSLMFEGCQLRFKSLKTLHGIIPALLKCCCDEAIAGIDRFVTPFRQTRLVTRALDAQPPLPTNFVISLLQSGKCRKCEFDSCVSHSTNEPLGDRLIKRRGRNR